MALTDFTIIRRSMTSRMFSTVTTTLTVGIAVGLMLVLLSMRDSAKLSFERGSGNMHLLASRDASPLESVLNGVFYLSPPRAPITWKEYEELSQRFPWEYAVPVQQGDSYKGFPTLATTPEFFSAFRPAVDTSWELASGKYFEKEWQVVVGASAAAQAGLKLGDKIVMTHGTGASRTGGEAAQGGMAAAPHIHTQFKFEVVGILKPTGTAHDRALFTNLNSSWVVHAFDRVERSHGEDHDHSHGHEGHDHEGMPIGVEDITDADRLITGVYLRAAGRPGRDASAFVPVVFEAIRREGKFTIAAPADQITRLFVIVGNINQIILGMAAAVMVSSGIAIMVALYNSMEQRRRQIAVLRVLGCSQLKIFGLILTESAILGLLGSACGVLISLTGGFIVSTVMRERLGLMINPSFSPDWLIGVLLGAVLLSTIAGVIPALMAYHTPVVKNLKPIG